MILPFFLTGCIFKKKSTVVISPQSEKQNISSNQAELKPIDLVNSYLAIEPKSVDEVLSQNLELASLKVLDWKKDALLYHFSAKLPPNLAAGQATLVYTFGSKSEAFNWWTLSVSGRTGKAVRAIIPKEDFLGTTALPIPLAHWKMNFVEAFQLADINGGAEYRQQYPDASISVNLSVGEPKNFLWYSVEYEAAGAETLKILINPSTKEIEDNL